jgi:hypothetical protein
MMTREQISGGVVMGELQQQQQQQQQQSMSSSDEMTERSAMSVLTKVKGCVADRHAHYGLNSERSTIIDLE